MKRIGLFALVGGVGFVVDAGIFLVLQYFCNFNAIVARLGSFLLAVTATWILNRTLTFKSQSRSKLKEWGQYLSANALGAAVNLGIYFILILHIIFFTKQPFLALVIASGVAMFFNYFMARCFVFKLNK